MRSRPDLTIRSSRRARVSLADVAAAANVSVMTVSNVVRGRTDLVKEETRERVQAAIDALNYRPQILGRALRTARLRIIGLLIVVLDENFLSATWTAHMVAGLSNYLNRRDYGLLVHGQSPLKLDESLLHRLSETDGLCVMLAGSEEIRTSLLRRITRLGNPVVALQEHLSCKQFDDFAIVRQDDYGAGRQIGKHLRQQGATKLLFLEPAFSFPAMSQRLDGLRAEMPRGGRVDKAECGNGSAEEVESAIQQYLAEHRFPDAIVAANEQLTLGLLASLQRRGVAVPRDVLVASFNAFDLWANALRGVTTIDFPAYDLGARAGQRILERLEGNAFKSSTDILPAKLIISSSSMR